MTENVKYYPCDADARDFPRPSVPMLPQPGLNFLRVKPNKDINSVFLNKFQFFKQGRYAIAEALKLMGVNEQSLVLVPSYHCRTLVEPVTLLGAKLKFYKLESNLQINFSHIRKLLEEYSGSIKALVVTHYFGFPQQMERLIEVCHEHNIQILEDCAHAFYGSVNGKLLGSYGEYSIASPRKFFPIEDGGILVCNTKRPAFDFQHLCNNKEELKAIIKFGVRLFQNIFQRKNKLALNNNVENVKKVIRPKEETQFEEGLKWFNPEKRYEPGYVVSKVVLRHSSHMKIIQKRRQNYKTWLEGVAGLKGCSPLNSSLSDETVPYVFPLKIEKNVDSVFYALKMSAIPIWRWEDLAVSDCTVSINYRLSLIQLPCHQSLTADQLSWLIETTRAVFNRVNH